MNCGDVNASNHIFENHFDFELFLKDCIHYESIFGGYTN